MLIDINIMDLKIKILKENARINEPAHKGDAGYDVYATEDYIIKPFTNQKIPLGIALSIPENKVCIVHQKSGLASKTNYNTIGNVIDSNYRGEIHAIIQNNNQNELYIKANEKIAQLVFHDVWTPKITYVKELDQTTRGTDGFGSTGL